MCGHGDRDSKVGLDVKGVSECLNIEFPSDQFNRFYFIAYRVKYFEPNRRACIATNER
jgi:hypothetical protein